jgi:hypothetical protein
MTMLPLADRDRTRTRRVATLVLAVAGAVTGIAVLVTLHRQLPATLGGALLLAAGAAVLGARAARVAPWRPWAHFERDFWRYVEQQQQRSRRQNPRG